MFRVAPYYCAAATLWMTCAGMALAADAPAANLELSIDNLRNHRGMLRICVTKDRHHFPDCAGDPDAARKNLPASSGTATFSLAPGTYAVSLIHDENANGKLDKVMGIPKEGFAFSRNPAIRFGPPRYDEVSVTVTQNPAHHSLRVRYLL